MRSVADLIGHSNRWPPKVISDSLANAAHRLLQIGLRSCMFVLCKNPSALFLQLEETRQSFLLAERPHSAARHDSSYTLGRHHETPPRYDDFKPQYRDQRAPHVHLLSRVHARYFFTPPEAKTKRRVKSAIPYRFAADRMCIYQDNTVMPSPLCEKFARAGSASLCLRTRGCTRLFWGCNVAFSHLTISLVKKFFYSRRYTLSHENVWSE